LLLGECIDLCQQLVFGNAVKGVLDPFGAVSKEEGNGGEREKALLRIGADIFNEGCTPMTQS